MARTTKQRFSVLLAALALGAVVAAGVNLSADACAMTCKNKSCSVSGSGCSTCKYSEEKCTYSATGCDIITEMPQGCATMGDPE